MSEWQEMKTAPKDGSAILLAWYGNAWGQGAWYVRQARWVDETQIWLDDIWRSKLEPDVWAPLPTSRKFEVDSDGNVGWLIP
jgi:hypothetical protein